VSNITTASAPISPEIIEKVVVGGDLAKLSTHERLSYYSKVCESVGLNPLTRPFEYIQLNGKLTLYARRDATDQLRTVYKVSVNITSREIISDVYVVTAKAKNADGREDESTGAVFVGGLRGEALANAMMKAETKAKRRVTLSLCGLGMLDETEVETIAQEESAPKEKAKAIVADSSSPGDYQVSFGKFKGQPLNAIEDAEIANYMSYIEQKAREDNKPIQGKVAEFMGKADLWLRRFELEEA
jgi:hypothetical protein